MDKLAQVKLAEARGVMAALIDAGIVKIADERVFGALSEVVSTQLSNDYDMDEMLQKTADVLEAAEDLLLAKENLEAAVAEDAVEDDAGFEDEGMDLVDEDLESIDKEAAEMVYEAHKDLLLVKQAGEIDDVNFVKEANRIMNVLNKLLGRAPKKPQSRASKAWNEVKGAATGRDIKAAMPTPAKDRYLRDPSTFKELDKGLLAKGLAKTVGLYGGGAAAAGGAGYAATR